MVNNYSQTRWKCILARTWTWDQKGSTIVRAIRLAQWRHHTGRSGGKAKRATGTQPKNSSQRRACSKHKHSRCVMRPGEPPETAPPERETARADLNWVGQRQKGRWGKAQVTREGKRATSSESCHSSWRLEGTLMLATTVPSLKEIYRTIWKEQLSKQHWRRSTEQCEMEQRQTNVAGPHFYVKSQKTELIATESWMVVTRGWEMEEKGGEAAD